MTRRRIIAGVILLAAVAVAVPAAPGVWETVAYVEMPPPPPSASLHVLVKRNEPWRDEFPEITVTAESSLLSVRRKRHSWVPGAVFLVPDQVCPMCRIEDHPYCFPRHSSGVECELFDGTEVDVPESFRCTCTDPSHDRDSE